MRQGCKPSEFSSAARPLPRLSQGISKEILINNMEVTSENLEKGAGHGEERSQRSFQTIEKEET